MRARPALIALLARLEGVSTTVYKDSAGLDTIGIGHLVRYPVDTALKQILGSDFKSADLKYFMLDDDQVEDLLDLDIRERYMALVPTIRELIDLKNNQIDAILSLAFNIGTGAFKNSTVLRKLKEGDEDGAADAFLLWNKETVNGVKRISKGLNKRRHVERLIFKSPVVDLDKQKDLSSDVKQEILDIVYQYNLAVKEEYLSEEVE